MTRNLTKSSIFSGYAGRPSGKFPTDKPGTSRENRVETFLAKKGPHIIALSFVAELW
jgi:hypothetical protein